MKFVMYGGIKEVDKIPHLVLVVFLENDSESLVKIPIDQLTADRISKYLSRFAPPAPQAERLNDEPSE